MMFIGYNYPTIQMPAWLHTGQMIQALGGAQMANSISGIYCIENTQNGHRYIGSSGNITQRFGDHKSSLKRGRHVNKHLQSAWNKYGADAFKFSVIEYCDVDQLAVREQFYIDSTNPEYNKARGVFASMLGYKHSAETVEKNRQSHIGLVQSEESKEKKRAYRHTAEAIQKIIQASTNRVKTDETKNKISRSHLWAVPNDPVPWPAY